MRHRISISIIVLVIASLACGQSVSVAPADPNAASTAIVETIVAIQAHGTESAILSSDATVTLIPTVTPFPPPTLPFTATPTTPQISVYVDTVCRVGPGKEYEKVGILLVGETTDIIGRHATGQFWYVRNPDVGPDFCWMSGEYATISGNTLVLLIQTPESAPATDFEAVYRGMGHCTTSWWSDIRLKNLSDGWFQSISMTLTDADTNTTRSTAGNDFIFKDGCSTDLTTVDALIQNNSVMVSSPEFPYSLNGHNINASITLCANINLGGGCVTRTITYIP